MSHLFKAKEVGYDTRTLTFFEGEEIVVSVEHIVKFWEVNLGFSKKSEGMGKIFMVDTVNNYDGNSLRVTSNYLEKMFEHTE